MIENKYDVFICFKHSTEDGQITEDSVLAERLYEYLTHRGLSVFFSKRELEFLGVSQYNVTINKALEASRFLIAVGCSRSNLESQWVQYEWSSFQNEIRSETKQNGELYVLYQGMNPKDLPYALRQHQAFNAADAGTFEKIGNFIANALRHSRVGEKSNEAAAQTPISRHPPPIDVTPPPNVQSAVSAPPPTYYPPHADVQREKEPVIIAKQEYIAPKWLSNTAKIVVLVLPVVLVCIVLIMLIDGSLGNYRYPFSRWLANQVAAGIIFSAFVITAATIIKNCRSRRLNLAVVVLNACMVAALFFSEFDILTLFAPASLFVPAIIMSKYSESSRHAIVNGIIILLGALIIILLTRYVIRILYGPLADAGIVNLDYRFGGLLRIYGTPFIVSAIIAALSVYFLRCGRKKAMQTIVTLMLSAPSFTFFYLFSSFGLSVFLTVIFLPTILFTISCLNHEAYLSAFGKGNAKSTLIKMAVFFVIFGIMRVGLMWYNETYVLGMF